MPRRTVKGKASRKVADQMQGFKISIATEVFYCITVLWYTKDKFHYIIVIAVC